MEREEKIKSEVPIFDLAGKKAIITGVSRGIGEGIARAFAGYGCDLLLVDMLESELAGVADDIRETYGVQVVTLAGSVCESSLIDRIVSTAVETWGRIDILVNNAGVGMTCLAQDVDEELFDEVIDTDLKAVFFLAKRVAEVMRPQMKGNIINLGSVVATAGSSRMSVYMAAKAGVVHMTRALAFEWARFNIRVNAICPGYIQTGMTEDTLANPRAYDAITGMIPGTRKVGVPKDIAAAAVFLASDCTEMITGADLYVDAGRSIW